LPNVLFVQSAVEALPAELNGLANQVHVNLPWGSLLRAVAGGPESGLRNLHQLCAPDALLIVVIGLDVAKDQSELTRLGLPSLDSEYLTRELPVRYQRAGFEIVKTETLTDASLSEMKTTWARRLMTGHNRLFIRIEARSSAVSG